MHSKEELSKNAHHHPFSQQILIDFCGERAFTAYGPLFRLRGGRYHFNYLSSRNVSAFGRLRPPIDTVPRLGGVLYPQGILPTFGTQRSQLLFSAQPSAIVKLVRVVIVMVIQVIIVVKSTVGVHFVFERHDTVGDSVKKRK